MASDTEIKFYGLWHLAGETVQAALCGIDCGDYTVASDGTITVTIDPAPDEQGFVTPTYIAANDGWTQENATSIKLYVEDVLMTVTVPVVIGKSFTSRGQTLRPALGQDLGIRQTNGLGKIRRAHEYAVLLNKTVDISIGTTFDNMDAVALTRADGETPFPSESIFIGVCRGILTDTYDYDSMLCWEVDRPVPAMVCAISALLVAEE